MTEPEQVIVVPGTDPLYQAWIWRQDSALLFQLRPILERLRDIPDQPCLYGLMPYTCRSETDNLTCVPCVIREIKVALFGATKQPEEQPDGDTDRPGGADDTAQD